MRVGVVVCADEPRVAADGAIPIERLCTSPGRLSDLAIEADRLVLVLHPRRFDLAAVQTAVRATGIDPLGVQILEAEPGMDLSRPLCGLRARAAAYAGSEPEHAKPILRGEVTRRGLFRAPRPVYLGAPLVDHATCAAADGCRACVDVCPKGAYRWHQGRIHFNKDVCDPCGRCVTTCPTEAIGNPTLAPAMLAAQIRALLDSSDDPTGLRFVCSRRDVPAQTDQWQDVVVPCTGMVPGTWLIEALLLGAAAVALPGCAENGCHLGLDTLSAPAVDFARAALEAAGLDDHRVRRTAVGDLSEARLDRPDLPEPFTRVGAVAAMLALDSLMGGGFWLEHEGASHGAVSIDAAACTLCSQCAQTCPTNAISAGYDGSAVRLTFDASRCTYCRQCTIACPEIARGAIVAAGVVDPALLRSEPIVINEGTVLMCESCGKPVAPAPMMDRIGELLGEDFSDTMAYLSRRCLDCRGVA